MIERRIRKNVEQFLLKEPNLFLYVRRDLGKPCLQCRSTFYGGPRGWCDNCLGTGYNVRLEKVPVRRMLRGRLLDEAGISTAGYVSEKHVIVYTPAWLHPKDNDLFVEVLEWIGLYPSSVLRAYSIYASIPSSQSEVSFYSCYCNPHDVVLNDLVRVARGRSVVDLSRYEEVIKDGTAVF